MKLQMCIFNKFLSVVSVMAALGVTMPAHALIDTTGCDDENNLYVNPDLALCSTHVYNIGLTKNPDDSAHKQMIKDVVALKTTLITQQMYSQYEILETTVKRLKTQLEKQVLLDRLKAVSAAANGGSPNDSTSGSGTNGNDRNNPIGENCMTKTTQLNVIECLQNHIVLMDNTSDAGNVRRQLNTDIEVAKTWGIIEQKDLDEDANKTCSTNLSAQQKSVKACINWFRAKISIKKDNMNKPNNQQRNQGGWGQ